MEGLEDFTRVAERFANPEQEAQLTTSIENIEQTLIKYELADLRFSLGRPLKNLGPAGAKVLSSLIADEDRALDEDKSEAAASIGFLEDLVAETEQGAFERVIFCKSSFLGLEARMKATLHWKQLPPGFFPQEFEITDAYITNAPTINVFRNFYL